MPLDLKIDQNKVHTNCRVHRRKSVQSMPSLQESGSSSLFLSEICVALHFQLRDDVEHIYLPGTMPFASSLPGMVWNCQLVDVLIRKFMSFTHFYCYGLEDFFFICLFYEVYGKFLRTTHSSCDDSLKEYDRQTLRKSHHSVYCGV